MRFFKVTTIGFSLRVFCAAGLILAGTGAVFSAGAQDAAVTAPQVSDAAPPVDIIPAASAQDEGVKYDLNEITHPEIRMSPDKSELVRLEKPAASVIVGNPAHLSILADSSEMLVLIPKAPGATYFTVLGRDGNVLMQRHVLVAAPKEKYMRVRRSCAGSKDVNCQQTSVFYCPDVCHQILTSDEKGDSGASAANALQSAAEKGAGSADEEQPAEGGAAASEDVSE